MKYRPTGSMLVRMRKHTRTLVMCASAMIALGTLTACSGESTKTPASSSTAVAAKPFPGSAHYIADMPMQDGKTMTVGVAVEGDKIAAYACDGTSDEAWFFGTQKDGSLDIKSKYQDTLKASYDGTDVVGDLTMNDVTYHFSAPSVPAPAGMYTAIANGVRASWVVRPDQTVTGVQNSNNRDSDVADLVIAQEQEFRDKVRARRLARQLQQAQALQWGTWRSTINGTPVVATIINGDTRLT
jgi:hypothetical protein